MKISYQKHWGEDGTVYNQRVKISKTKYEDFCVDLLLEMASGFPLKDKYCFDGIDTIYMTPKDSEAKIVYLTLTETRFFNLMMGINLKNRNTYLVIE